MTDYNVLDLFCGLGGFSAAFEDSDRWAVTTVDVEDRFDPDVCADVFDLRPSHFRTGFDVVLASPPCNCFTIANGGHHIKNGKIQTERAREAVVLAHHTLGLIKSLEPRYWFLENPRGHLRKYMPIPPEGTITYCQFGMDYQKPTDLWGNHPYMEYPGCSPGDGCHSKRIGEEDSGAPTTAEERAKAPHQLSDAIRQACEAALDGDAPEQATVADFP